MLGVKSLILAALIFIVPMVHADDRTVVIYPTVPGSVTIDRDKPGLIIEDITPYKSTSPVREYEAYPTIPGTYNRDYDKPGFIIESFDPIIPEPHRSDPYRRNK